MMKYEKLTLALALFVLVIYATFVTIWQWQNFPDDMVWKLLLIFVVCTVYIVAALVRSAEGTTPYHIAERRRRQLKGAIRALRVYRDGWDDGGAFAGEVLERLEPGRRK